MKLIIPKVNGAIKLFAGYFLGFGRNLERINRATEKSSKRPNGKITGRGMKPEGNAS